MRRAPFWNDDTHVLDEVVRIKKLCPNTAEVLAIHMHEHTLEPIARNHLRVVV